jgi:hypothetical protein
VAAAAPADAVRGVADLLCGDGAVTLLVGSGAREARAQVLELADLLAAPDRRQEEVPTDAKAVTVDTSEARSGAVVGDIEGRAITGLALFS